MRWIPATVLLVAVGIGVSTASGAAQKASLRVADRDPLTLQGQGFQARERVRVTLSEPLSEPSVERRVTRATAAGSFRVVFLEISVTRCDSVRAIAVGGQGSRALLKFLPAPACMPMQSP